MSKDDTGNTTDMRDEDIAHDEDNPVTTAEDWEGAVMKRNGVVLGYVRTRGPQKAPTKVQTAIRFDADVLAALKASGKGWQTRVNDAIREWLVSRGAL